MKKFKIQCVLPNGEVVDSFCEADRFEITGSGAIFYNHDGDLIAFVSNTFLGTVRVLND